MREKRRIPSPLEGEGGRRSDEGWTGPEAAGFEIVNANGPVTWETEGNAVQFASLEQLAVNGEQQFDVVLVATAAGNRKVTVTLESADYDQPVITEEPVRVIPDAP